MYGKFQLLDEALEVFEELLVRDVFSWNALIGGHVDNGVLEEALLFYEQMQQEGVPPSHFTFTSCLKACGILGNIDKGYELHDEMIRRGFEIDTYTGNSLIDMYTKCGSLTDAESMFEKLPAFDPVSWTILIAKYVELGLEETALEFLESMETEGISPDTFAYLCGLKACTNIEDKEKSRELHSEVVKRGLDGDLVIGNALLDMYSKHRLLSDVVSVFKILPCRDVISWTGLISGYGEHGHHEEALHCFERMQAEKVSPDAVTFMYILKACGMTGADEKGKDFHSDILTRGFDAESYIGNVLVDMYAKCGCVEEAKAVFDGLSDQDAFSWNALCAAYAEVGMTDEALAWFEAMQQEGVAADVVSWNTVILLYIEGGENHRALRCYLQMQEQGLAPDSMAYTSILKACGNASALDVGRKIHAQIHAQLSRDIDDMVLATSFIDMYSKCGSMREAHEVFEAMPVKDLVAWNAVLTGQARHGETERALELFERMMREEEDGVQPDIVAFLNVLTVCCHAGLVDEARKYFRLMIHGYRIMPSIEHVNCLVDLLGRAGQLDEAVKMLENMPFQPDLVVWSTMLAACHKWGNSELGKQAFDGAVSLDDEHSAAFVLMSNLSVEPHS
jgi:pentatricopeptide repeat protein